MAGEKKMPPSIYFSIEEISFWKEKETYNFNDKISSFKSELIFILP